MKRIFVSLVCLLMTQASVFGFTLTVQEPNGAPVNNYRWIVEEDTTNWVIPGALVADSVAVDIHNSYAPVVLKGNSNSSKVNIKLPSNTRYVVSVLPDAGYAMSGKLVDLKQDTVIVVVNKLPIPTAQISVFAFHDNNPINNAPDIEPGLPGFTVIISDIGGQQMQDAFGNNLGTTYMQNPDGSFMLDADGAPITDMPGTGVILTDANGEVTIKYLAPGKYGVQVIPPGGSGWIQTSTIEGTKVVDAWVKSNEPPVFVELGPAAWHVFIGFVQQFNDINTLPNPGGVTGQITGRVVYNHFDRPPNLQGFYPGEPVDCSPRYWFTEIAFIFKRELSFFVYGFLLIMIYGFELQIIHMSINPISLKCLLHRAVANVKNLDSEL